MRSLVFKQNDKKKTQTSTPSNRHEQNIIAQKLLKQNELQTMSFVKEINKNLDVR